MTSYKIAVYAICTAFVPLMARLHRLRPWTTYFGLAAAVVAVDLVTRLPREVFKL